MSMTDPVADLLTRLRNASLARHASVAIPMSKLKLNIVRILEEEGFVRSFSVKEAQPRAQIVVALAYDHDKRSIIHGLRRVSTPGCRIYVSNNELPRVKNGLGIAIVSTSQGVMSDSRARTEGIGGEFLCEVW